MKTSIFVKKKKKKRWKLMIIASGYHKNVPKTIANCGKSLEMCFQWSHITCYLIFHSAGGVTDTKIEGSILTRFTLEAGAWTQFPRYFHSIFIFFCQFFLLASVKKNWSFKYLFFILYKKKIKHFSIHLQRIDAKLWKSQYNLSKPIIVYPLSTMLRWE